MVWKAGESGNPGGRPKLADDVRDLARAHTGETIRRLVYWMKSKDPRASVSASQVLLDRAWGRPAQPLTGEDGEGEIKIIIRNIIEEKRLALTNGQVIEHGEPEEQTQATAMADRPSDV